MAEVPKSSPSSDDVKVAANTSTTTATATATVTTNDIKTATSAADITTKVEEGKSNATNSEQSENKTSISGDGSNPSKSKSSDFATTTTTKTTEDSKPSPPPPPSKTNDAGSLSVDTTTTAATTNANTVSSSSGAAGASADAKKDLEPSSVAVKAADRALSISTSMAATTTTLPLVSGVGNENYDQQSSDLLLKASLLRMTDGLPRRELKMIVAEAEECEKALEQEIEMLTKALEAEENKQQNEEDGGRTPAVDTDKKKTVEYDDKAVTAMMESDMTPPDQYWTLSALLGRLRHDLTTPLPSWSNISAIREQNGLGLLESNVTRPVPPYLLKKRRATLLSTSHSSTSLSALVGSSGISGGSGTASGSTTPAGSGRSTPVFGVTGGGGGSEVSQFQRLIDIDDHPVYTKQHTTSDNLLALLKKIATNKSSPVFRKPVNSDEAPGYTDRIAFPMDLSVMKKLIQGEKIKSYRDFSQCITLICHNCVKYNGRESDYALVTREFESVCSELIWFAVQDEIADGGGGESSTTGSTTNSSTTANAAAASGGVQKPPPPPPVSTPSFIESLTPTVTPHKPNLMSAVSATFNTAASPVSNDGAGGITADPVRSSSLATTIGGITTTTSTTTKMNPSAVEDTIANNKRKIDDVSSSSGGDKGGEGSLGDTSKGTKAIKTSEN